MAGHPKKLYRGLKDHVAWTSNATLRIIMLGWVSTIVSIDIYSTMRLWLYGLDGLPLLIEGFRSRMRCPQSFRFWFQPPVGAPLPQSFVLLLVPPEKMQYSESRASQAGRTASGLSSKTKSGADFPKHMLMAQWQFSRVAFRNCGADPLSYTINRYK